MIILSVNIIWTWGGAFCRVNRLQCLLNCAWSVAFSGLCELGSMFNPHEMVCICWFYVSTSVSVAYLVFVNMHIEKFDYIDWLWKWLQIFSVSDISIHVIFSWTQIGRFGFSDREIGSQIGRFFRGKKYSILVSKIVICSTVDHCKMFYLPAYC